MRTVYLRCGQALLALVPALASLPPAPGGHVAAGPLRARPDARECAQSEGARHAEERILLGGPEHFLTLRHLVLRGSQREIGRRLAGIARDRHGWRTPAEGSAEAGALAQRLAYFESNAPFFLERARGVADSLGLELGAEGRDLTELGFGAVRGGCSVIFYPPSTTASGQGVLSRNYDFSTGDFRGGHPPPGTDPVTSAPYLLETHPDQGYATLAMCAYDLLGGVIDGMNSEGLCIALLADDEVLQRFGPRPAPPTAAGFGVLQIGRHLLETCADVEEAKAALRAARLYYRSIPCHYLVADRHGNSFVWENDVSMEHGHVFEGRGQVQASTNFMQHLHTEDERLPTDGRLGSFSRYRTILERAAEHGPGLDLAFMRETSACIAATGGQPTASRAVGRTLWRTLYFPEERRMEVDVYLGEGHGGEGERRSDWASVRLGHGD